MLNSTETENSAHHEGNDAHLVRAEPEIDQIRTLLFGDIQKANSERLTTLERRIAFIEENMPKQLNQIREQIALLETNAQASQRMMMLEIGKAISALGDQIARLARE